MLRLYQAEWCPSSHRVRQRLTELGIDFIAHQVEPSPQERDAMEAAVGSRIIPVVVLEDGTVLDGDAEQIVTELDRQFPKGANAHAREHYELRYKARDFE
jgi:glutaredoxin